MVVCHLIASGFAGGPEKQIVEQSARLVEQGWSVIVGSFRENRPDVEVIDNAKKRGLPTFLIETKSPFSPLAVIQLSKFINQFHIDLLVTHGYKATVIGYLARLRSRFDQLPVARGYTHEDWKVRLYESIDRWLLKRFPAVLCVSRATGDLLMRYGIHSDRIRVIHNAVACDPNVVALDLRQEFAISPQSPLLIAAGRLSPEKGHHYLVDAMKRLAASGSRACLILLGSGKELPRLEQQVATADLADRVFFGGFRKPILPYLAGADLVVNPSDTEGLPNVLLEALSVKTPVVATDVGGVAEIITDGKTGWLVPRARVDLLADAIKQALDNPSQAAALADNGQQLVKKSFSFKYQVAQFADLYSNIIRPSKPSSMDEAALSNQDKTVKSSVDL